MKPPSGKPQQGTFSQVAGGEEFANVKPTADHRWPRGFTPERLHDVASVMPQTTFDVEMPYRRSQADMQPLNERGRSAARDKAGPSYFTEPKASGIMENKQVFRARVVDTVARSTVPREDLQGLWFKAEHRPRADYLGVYHSTANRITMNTQGYSGSEAEGVLLHEIGHHVDKEADPSAFRNRQLGTYPSPGLEGFAEGYMTRHHVPRPGNGPATRMYDGSETSFHGEYVRRAVEASGGKISYTDYGQKQRGPRPAPAPEQPRQERLFQRGVNSFDTTVERDHGQWPLESWDKEPSTGLGKPVGTVRSGATEVPPLAQRLRPGFTEKGVRAVQAENEQRSGWASHEAMLSVARGETDIEGAKGMGTVMRTFGATTVRGNTDKHTHWR